MPATGNSGQTATTGDDRLPPSVIEGVEVALEAYVGEARITVAALQALAREAVVPLDAPISQAVELRLNGQAIARGELVVAGDAFGVRITEIGR